MKKVNIELLVTSDDQIAAVELFCRELSTFTEKTTDEAIPYMCADLSELEGKIAAAHVTQEAYDFTQNYEKFIDNTKKS